MNAFFTHRKYLIKELSNLDYDKPVIALEFGTGDGSAFVFNFFASIFENLRIESYDDNFNWFKYASDKYSLDNYCFNYVDSWDDMKDSFDNIYDLVFVDAGPDFAARIKIIDFIKSSAKVIILHDYDFYNKGIMEDHYSVGKGSFFSERYSNDFILQGNNEYPGTLVMRNRKL